MPAVTHAASPAGSANQVHLDEVAFPSSVAGTVSRASEIAGQGAESVADAVTGLMNAGFDPLSAAVGALTQPWAVESADVFGGVAIGGSHVQAASSATVGGLTGADAEGAADIASVPVCSV